MGAVKGKVLPVHKCPICVNFSTKRLTTLGDHFKSEHLQTSKEVWDLHNNGPQRCRCGCGAETKWVNWNVGYSIFIPGHNASIYDSYDSTDAARISKARSDSLKGKVGWSKGLTKDDARVARRAVATSAGRRKAFESGSIEIWNKSRSAQDDPRLAELANNLREKFAAGDLKPWAKGLTKDTDVRIASMAETVSLAMKRRALRDKLDTIKRLSISDAQKHIEQSGDLVVIDGCVDSSSRVIVVRCNRCGMTTQGSLRALSNGRCFHCTPGNSTAQDEIADFIRSLGLNVKRNEKKDVSLELEIYVEDSSFAVEYNGLYWHSDINKSNQYHSNKTKLAASRNISLLHVFEDEWNSKRSIVESIIASKLGVSSEIISARKCTVIELNAREKKEFFDSNHLDGDASSKVAWGLKFKDKIVYAISLRKSFQKKYHDSFEIARCCPTLNHNVQGGLSKLISVVAKYCAVNSAASLIANVDTRLGGTGKGYELAGFQRSSTTPLKWWWTDLNERFNRFKFKPNKSLNSSSIVKIWGCESTVYEIRF